MRSCPDSKHDFTAYEPRSMWSSIVIYCRKCGLRGPFEFTTSSTTLNASKEPA